MAGEARTYSFVQGAATVMVGRTDELWDLTPETHSLGLVKNVSVTASRSFTELNQNGKLVYSVKTGETATAGFDVYEYTARNLEIASSGSSGIDEHGDSYVDIGTLVEPFYAVKIVGAMPHRNTPIAVLFPKVRITSGMGLQFADDKFSAMPWSIRPHPLLPGDPHYYQFPPGTLARLYARSPGRIDQPLPGTRVLTLPGGRRIMTRNNQQIRI